MQPVMLSLSGKIYRDPETNYYVGEIAEWNLTTCGENFEKTIEMLWHSIDAFLVASRKLGSLAEAYAKANARPASVEGVRARTTLVFEIAGSRTIIESERDVSVAA